MERRDHDAGAERSRNWKDWFCEVLRIAGLFLVGVIIGIVMCKFGLNSWIDKNPWFCLATLFTGGTCIAVSLCMEDDL